MVQKSITAGVILVILGVVVTIASDSNSATSLIPAFVGVIYLLLGIAGKQKPDLNHHFMHGAAAISLLAIFGSIGSLIGRGSAGWALFAQIATSVICAVFLVSAIQSFKAARSLREENS
ncbi:MAG: hypothetical protein CL455_06190 [Acidimicrobiaceae bacterium]|nr:hypothetical protein [Acidimicrobiaceae bacterium]|tara:strand:+ start:568 stop:924 length:357 start_codon:yes stop_codon:yes gene_type:complete